LVSHLSRKRNNKSEQTPLDTITLGDKVVVYKKANQFNDEMYIVEISKFINDKNRQTVSLYSLLGHKQYYLSIPVSTYGDAEIEPESIVSRLKLKGDGLVYIPRNKRCSKVQSNSSRTEKIPKSGDNSLDCD